METTTRTRIKTLKFNLKRLLNFLKLFIRNGRAAFGMAIILLFVAIALLAPMLTPYDALGMNPERSGALAGKRVAPTWLRNIPSILGGNPTLSENLEPIADPSLPKLWSQAGLLNVSVSPSSSGVRVSAATSAVNYPYIVSGFNFPNKNGSLALTFQRPEGYTANETKVIVYSDFDYPFSGVPDRYVGNFELLVNGSYVEHEYPTERWFVVQIKAGSMSDKIGNLTFVASTGANLHVAAADISEFLRNPPLGYATWKDWMNGTGTLPGHWNTTSWVVSEGSLTNKTYAQLNNSTYAWAYHDTGNVSYVGFRDNLEICDSNLTMLGNGPDIVRTANWTKKQTFLTNASFVGDTRISVDSTVGWPKYLFGPSTLIYVSIGSNETEETHQIKDFGSNYVLFPQGLRCDHAANETVTLRAQTITLFENLQVLRRKDVYLLVKFSLEDPYELYSIYATGFSGAQIKDGDKSMTDPYNQISLLKITRTERRLNVPVKVRAFLGPAGEPIDNLLTLFPRGARITSGFYKNATTGDVSINRPLSGLADNSYWILCRDSKSSEISLMDSEDPVAIRRLFNDLPGKYRFGVELTFLDYGFIDQNVTTTVYIDDFALKLYGTSFGLLGADQYGRDLFSQLLYGTRISIYLGLLVAFISIAIGLLVGLLAGYAGGAADQFLMRFNDLLLVLPGLPLMIVLVAVLGARIENLVLLLGFLGWNGFARLVRSQVLSLKERPFIEAAKAAGAGTGHIIIRHILPHVMALVYVSLATSVPGAITAEAALSWLGFYDPNRMSWGRMLHEVFAAGATRNWWWVIPPGLCISLVAVAFILLGFALDDILNPKLRMRK